MKFALSLLLWALLLLEPAPVYAGPTSNDLADLALDPHTGARLPLGIELVDEAGRSRSLGSFFGGKPVVLILEYLRCKWVCGLALGNLAEAGSKLPLRAGRDYTVLAISIDPRDTPQDAAVARAKYNDRYGPAAGIAGWHFLTGPETAVRPIADAVGFHYRYDAAADQYIHSVGYAVAAADGEISGYLTDLDVKPEALEAGLAAAAAGEVSGPLTRLLLLCFGQGALSGRYTATIETVLVLVNLIGMLTAIFVFAAVRRRRNG
jgi:protein SCO1/2